MNRRFLYEGAASSRDWILTLQLRFVDTRLTLIRRLSPKRDGEVFAKIVIRDNIFGMQV